MVNSNRQYNFDRHSVSIHLNSILASIRGSKKVSETDRIVVQAVLEIIGDFRNYGPLSISIKSDGYCEVISVFYDNACVVTIILRGQDVGISYLRDSEQHWISPLISIASAHASLILGQ